MKSKQEYLLDCLQEECAEIIQIIGKIKRFGIDDVWPNQEKNPEQHDNRMRLKLECNDYQAVVEDLRQLGVDLSLDDNMVAAKKARLSKYMDFSRSKGLVE